MRIIGIGGAITLEADPDTFWDHFKNAFQRYYPEASFVRPPGFFLYWEFQKMRDLADRIVAQYDDGEDTLFVGHSYGGSISCAVAPRFKKSKVLGIVTVFSPHTLFGGFFSRKLGVDLQKSLAPIVSFGGRREIISLLGGARHPLAERHHMLPTGHLLKLILSQKPAEEVARVAHEVLIS